MNINSHSSDNAIFVGLAVTVLVSIIIIIIIIKRKEIYKYTNKYLVLLGKQFP